MLNILTNCGCCNRSASKNQLNNDSKENNLEDQMMSQRNHFLRIFHKYPDFFHTYCMCLHQKIEPNDLNGIELKSSSVNSTPIIPITVDPTVYVF